MDNVFNASRAVFIKRAKAKFTQEKLLNELVKLDSPLSEKYEAAKFCSSVLLQNGNNITSRYCNQRFCKICNRIRTAKLMIGYGPIIAQFKEPYFVTLTIPNPTAEQLRPEIRKMISEVKKIQDLRRKHKQELIKGIRKLEITYNPDENNYHPHFHFIIDKETTANELIEAWLYRYPTAIIKAQDKRPAENPIELFKYFAKLTSKSKNDTIIIRRGKMVRIEYSYPEALDICFRAITKTRIIQPMGGIKMFSEDIEEIESIEIEDINEDAATWIFYGHDWLNMHTGEFLSGYEPSRRDLRDRKKIRYLHYD